MGPGITTLDLIHLMPRHPGAVLDLGCGAGTLALLAAVRGAPRAVGVDINSRAVALARFNARLNQNSAEFRVGDLVEPVAGERFDQVFSQPPYVVQPPGVAATTYLHGGPSGDELAIRFAAAVPAVLAPRGRAIFYFDSALGPRRPLRDRLNDALGSAPVDLHILAAPGPSPDLQAVAYASIEVPDLGESYPETVRRYREHLESTGASRFIRALVILTRSDRSGERTSFQLPAGGFSGLDAEALDAFLSGLDLSRAPDTELLATPVRVSPQARFVEEHLPSDPQGEPKRSIRFERRALGTDREISEGGQALFAALQAAPSVAAAVETFAAACEEEPAAVMKEVIGFVRDGLARALLVRG